jgi:hypothetical protein
MNANRFAARVKNRGDISESENEELAKFFPRTNFGEINIPAIILDKHSRILAWHLPDILSSGRVVSLLGLDTQALLNAPFSCRKMLTWQLHLSTTF